MEQAGGILYSQTFRLAVRKTHQQRTHIKDQPRCLHAPALLIDQRSALPLRGKAL
ncbi:MAG: hypothetical protein WC612_07125 [Bdellovibrionales bacterium]